VSVSTHTIDLDDPEQTEKTVEAAEEMAPQYTEITGRRADKLVEGARAAGYTPQSGLVHAWEEAVVQRFDGWQLVTVPLTGTDVPELSKVTYFKQGPTAEVVEWAAAFESADTVRVDGWQNGAKIREASFVIEGLAEDAGSIATVGFNWSKFERCVTAGGLPKWVADMLATVCAFVCIFTLGVGCIACIAAWAGGWTAIIYDCVRRAWT